MSKRLIVCCDGTWNQLNDRVPTNLRRLSRLIPSSSSDGTAQLVHYQDGIGTQWYDKLPGGAFGAGIDGKIQEVYRFLCDRYVADDEIYLFGYSRGAYTVRSLGGLIDCVGLLPADQADQVEAAYSIYRIQNYDKRQATAAEFRSTYQSQRVPITLLGCWDTVGALGIPDLIPNLPFDYWANKPYRFHNIKLSHLIQNALHVAALDEQQKVFPLTPMEVPEGSPTRLKQLWFPGNHAIVGSAWGSGLADLTLAWMVQSVRDFGLGLEFDQAQLNKLQPNPLRPNIPDLYAERRQWRFPFLSILGLQVRDVHVVPSSDNLQYLFHPSVRDRWCQDGSYRPKCLVDRGWASILDAVC